MFQSCYKVLYPIFNTHYIIFYKHFLEEDLHCKQIYLLQGSRCKLKILNPNKVGKIILNSSKGL